MKNNKKFFRITAVICMVALTCGLLTGCFGNSKSDADTAKKEDTAQASDKASSGENTVELSIAHIGALESPSNLAVEHFIELVEERSGGSIKITNYPASQLGADRDILEGSVGGTIDMGIPAAGVSTLYLPEYYIFDAMYMFESEEHLKKVAEGELGQEIADKFLDKTGVRVLTQNWERGTRQSIFSKDVEDLPDFAGVKIRLPEIDSYLKGYELLGAKPTIIAFNETYSSLQQGVVDGMECPLDWIYDNKFYEVCKNLVMTNHVYSVMTVLINDQKFNTLSDEQKKILEEASVEAGNYQNDLLHEKEEEYLKMMKEEGVKVYEPDLKPFRDAVEPMLPDMVNEWGDGLYDKVMSYK